MLRLFYAALISAVGVGLVHIAVLLLLPQFSARDAWSSLAEAADFYKAVRIDSDAGETPLVRSGDPFFYAAACRFDLDDGAVHVRAPGKIPFWSVSIYNRGGHNVYSFNDRATDSGSLDFVVLTSEQMIEMRKQLPEELKQSIFHRGGSRRRDRCRAQLRPRSKLAADGVDLPGQDCLYEGIARVVACLEPDPFR